MMNSVDGYVRELVEYFCTFYQNLASATNALHSWMSTICRFHLRTVRLHSIPSIHLNFFLQFSPIKLFHTLLSFIHSTCPIPLFPSKYNKVTLDTIYSPQPHTFTRYIRSTLFHSLLSSTLTCPSPRSPSKYHDVVLHTIYLPQARFSTLSSDCSTLYCHPSYAHIFNPFWSSNHFKSILSFPVSCISMQLTNFWHYTFHYSFLFIFNSPLL